MRDEVVGEGRRKDGRVLQPSSAPPGSSGALSQEGPSLRCCSGCLLSARSAALMQVRSAALRRRGSLGQPEGAARQQAGLRGSSSPLRSPREILLSASWVFWEGVVCSIRKHAGVEGKA